MLSKKKKVFILCGMLALLIVTGVLNIVLNGNAISANSGNSGDGGNNNLSSASFFDTYRSDRIATREQTILYLDAIINNADSDSAAVESARQSKLELTQNMELELVLEGLIKALGFDDVVVTNSTESINVIVKAAELDEVQVTQITEIIVTETNKTSFDVRIIPVE
ncbi:MAG: SpoIIIAH-like family protein [Clostridiales bacterium]|nr:SpoIIIAH-like family protein [Clostridiales bacterium]